MKENIGMPNPNEKYTLPVLQADVQKTAMGWFIPRILVVNNFDMFARDIKKQKFFVCWAGKPTKTREEAKAIADKETKKWFKDAKAELIKAQNGQPFDKDQVIIWAKGELK